MDISVEHEAGVVWVGITGRVDGSTAEECHERVMAALEPADRFLVLDATDLSYISSAGLRTILRLVKHLDDRGGKLVLCGLSPEVREVFRTSGFDKIMPIVADREAARAAV